MVTDWAWLRRFLDAYQILALNSAATDEPAPHNLTKRLAAAIPPQLTAVQELLVRLLLDELKVRAQAASGRASCGLMTKPIRALLGETVATVESESSLRQHHIDEPRVRAMLAMIRESHSEPNLNLRKVARRVGLSSWYATRLIKRCTGHPFSFHLRDARLSKAELLLRTTFESVKEVTTAAGYSRTAELDRNFKREFGVLPTEYRRTHGRFTATK
jgi:AraC-like DNA-binding protein